MNVKDKFLYLEDYVDTRNICDCLIDFLDEEQLKEFCEYLEDEYDVEYENNYISEDDDL